jgi:uncharacterized membrane protein
MSAVSSDAYKFFLVLHLFAVAVAFGPVVLAFARGEDQGSLRAHGRTVVAPAMIVAGLLGIVLVLLAEDGTWEFSQAWISIAFLLWIAMVGVLQAIVIPGKRLGGGGRRRSGGVDVQTGEAIITVLFVIMLFLMVFKPGSPF